MERVAIAAAGRERWEWASQSSAQGEPDWRLFARRSVSVLAGRLGLPTGIVDGVFELPFFLTNPADTAAHVTCGRSDNPMVLTILCGNHPPRLSGAIPWHYTRGLLPEQIELVGSGSWGRLLIFLKLDRKNPQEIRF